MRTSLAVWYAWKASSRTSRPSCWWRKTTVAVTVCGKSDAISTMLGRRSDSSSMLAQASSSSAACSAVTGAPVCFDRCRAWTLSRSSRVNLETSAATKGDLWIVDRKTGTLIAGDLVTLPFPFLDTADPKGWSAALDRIAATKFTRLVPGHGPVMTRAEFKRYRSAYQTLLACTGSVAECTTGWLGGVGPLVPESDHAFVRQAMQYYVPMLRK